MLSSFRFFLYLLVLRVAGAHSSTLRVHPSQSYSRSQNRGFFTVDAEEDLLDGGGGGAGAAAPRLPLGAASATGGGPGSGVYPQYRSRRSAGASAIPKVYGQVMSRSASVTLVPKNRNAVQKPRLILAAKAVFQQITQPLLFSVHHLFSRS